MSHAMSKPIGPPVGPPLQRRNAFRRKPRYPPTAVNSSQGLVTLPKTTMEKCGFYQCCSSGSSLSLSSLSIKDPETRHGTALAQNNWESLVNSVTVAMEQRGIYQSYPSGSADSSDPIIPWSTDNSLALSDKSPSMDNSMSSSDDDKEEESRGPSDISSPYEDFGDDDNLPQPLTDIPPCDCPPELANCLCYIRHPERKWWQEHLAKWDNVMKANQRAEADKLIKRLGSYEEHWLRLGSDGEYASQWPGLWEALHSPGNVDARIEVRYRREAQRLENGPTNKTVLAPAETHTLEVSQQKKKKKKRVRFDDQVVVIGEGRSSREDEDGGYIPVGSAQRQGQLEMMQMEMYLGIAGIKKTTKKKDKNKNKKWKGLKEVLKYGCVKFFCIGF